MAKIVGLPKLSPTMEEGTLARWVKSEGERVEIDDLIAEVETDKATMEWRAFDPGVLLKILVEEGTELEPDAPVAIFGEEGEDISDLLAQLESGGATPVAAAPPEELKAEPKAAAPAAATDTNAVGASTPAGRHGVPQRADGRVLASPLVRRLAREKDIDLAQIAGTGPGGRIIKRDLEGAIASGTAVSASAAPAVVRGQRLPPRVERVSQMRKTIARRLTESKQTVPHFYLTIDLDMGPLMSARKKINAELAEQGEKVSVNDLIIKAAALALRKVPDANASFMGSELHYHQVVDISVAVAIPDGLLTPVVRDADLKTALEIGREVRELAGRARDKKLKPEEMTNGTFSISNLGMFGIEEFSAVINPPEGCILAVGTLRTEPVVVDGQITVGQRMRVTLSCDHRVVDGALGAQWLQAFKKLIETPVLMLV